MFFLGNIKEYFLTKTVGNFQKYLFDMAMTILKKQHWNICWNKMFETLNVDLQNIEILVYIHGITMTTFYIY